MKIPWPEDFEDGDVKSFLEDFEDVAEVSGLKTDGGKIAALRTLLKGRAKMTLEAARRGPAKMEWAAAKEVLLAEFDSPADRQEAMRQFKMARLGASEDPLVYLVRLQKLLDRAMPDLDPVSSEQLVADRYVDGLTPGLSSHLRVARASGGFDMQALVRLTRELIYNGVTVNSVVSEQSTSWQMPTTTGVSKLFGEDRKIVTSADLSSPLMSIRWFRWVKRAAIERVEQDVTCVTYTGRVCVQALPACAWHPYASQCWCRQYMRVIAGKAQR